VRPSKKSLLLAAFCVSLASGAVAVPSAALARPTHPRVSPAACAAVANPYRAKVTTLSACGYKFFPRQRTRALPGGGTSYVYNVDGGTLTYNIPPAGFDALTASPNQLREYNLPSKAVLGTRSWTTMMRNLHFVTPARTLIQGPASTAFVINSGNWAGVVASGHSDYNEVIADYTEPHIGSSVCSPDAEGTWVGLGGVSDALGQEGTAYGTGHPHGPWWEIVRANDSNLTGPNYQNWTASAGDHISTVLVYNGSKYTFTLDDDTSGRVMSVSYTTTVYGGNTAEVITEVPGGYDLSNFGTIPVSNAKAVAGSTTKDLAGFTYNRYQIWDGSRVMASATAPTNPSGGSKFSISQSHCD
jgi:hypothetical protein